MLLVLTLGDGSLLSISVGAVDVVIVGAVIAFHQHDSGALAGAFRHCADFIDSNVFENARHHATSFDFSPRRLAISRLSDADILDQNCENVRRSAGEGYCTPAYCISFHQYFGSATK